MNTRHDPKRRKIECEKKAHNEHLEHIDNNAPADDKIDPVEKLLSFSHVNTDILSLMNDTESGANSVATASAAPAYPNISCNFKKAIHDNMRLYYSKFRKSQMEIHNDHSSFSVLNEPPKAEQAQAPPKSRYQVPFFKNVNFSGPTGHHIDDYIHYDDDDELTTDSEEEIASPKGIVETPIPALSGKMSFHYRQNDKLNLSDEQSAGNDTPDVLQFLTKRSVLSGKASEMIGTSSFLVSDFFF